MPLTGSLERAFKGGPVYAWEPEKGVHIGVMPRNGSVQDLQWFRGEASYVFHPMNAFSTADGKIICDVCEYPEAPLFPAVDGTPGDPNKALAKLVPQMHEKCKKQVADERRQREIQQRKDSRDARRSEYAKAGMSNTARIMSERK